MPKDYYETLEISRGASADEIQNAYRQLAREYHPDLNPDDKGAKAKFQEVQKAYEVLNDPEKRKLYDRHGSSFDQMGGGPRGPAGWTVGACRFSDVALRAVFGGGAGGGGGGGFADILRQFTQGASTAGRRKRREATPRGRNLRHEVTVSFHNAVLGGEVPLTFVDTLGNQKTINVKIPAGITDGKKIRLRGQGEPAPRGGAAGDLLITVRTAPHPCFRRHGHDLELTVPITLTEAALGAKVDVPTPKGTISLTIPPGTSSGKRLRVRSLGVETADGTKGDLFAEVQIVLPDNLDQAQVELLRKVERGRNTDPRAKLLW